MKLRTQDNPKKPIESIKEEEEEEEKTEDKATVAANGNGASSNGAAAAASQRIVYSGEHAALLADLPVKHASVAVISGLLKLYLQQVGFGKKKQRKKHFFFHFITFTFLLPSCNLH